MAARLRIGLVSLWKFSMPVLKPSVPPKSPFVSALGNVIMVRPIYVKFYISFLLTYFITDMHIEDPVPQYTYFVNKIKELFPDLAYLHVTEPRFVYLEDRDPKDEVRVFPRG